jgi:hypothetical protein
MTPASALRLECAEAFSLGEGCEGLRAAGNALRVASREVLHDDFALARGEHRPANPIEFVHDEGRTPCDVIGTTYGALMLVSARLVAVLREHEFTGWATFPVRVVLDDGSELDGYRGLAATGRCGAIDDSLSGKVTIPPPVPGGRPAAGLLGLCFAPESWDGSDVFTAEGYAGSFVVERVKEALERAGITNAGFRRLSEIERTWRADGSLIEAE